MRGVLCCSSWCFCKREGRSDRIKSSIFAGMQPYMSAISTSSSTEAFTGTGFLIRRNLLLTTHTVLPTAVTATASIIRFLDGSSVRLSPTRFFITSSFLDLTIVCTETTADADPPYLRGCTPSSLDLGSEVYFLGHKGREVVVGEGKVVIATDTLVKLSTEAAWGSGSAGFDRNGQLAFMVCDPTRLATSSSSSSSSSGFSVSRFGISMTVVCDFLDRHSDGLAKPDHKCASFTFGRVQGTALTAGDESGKVKRADAGGGNRNLRFLDINLCPRIEACKPASTPERSSTGSVDGVCPGPDRRSSEEETMYSAETAESRNYSTPPRQKPATATVRSLSSSSARDRTGPPGSTAGSRVMSRVPVRSSQKGNDYFSPTVSSMKKRNNSAELIVKPKLAEAHASPRWMP